MSFVLLPMVVSANGCRSVSYVLVVEDRGAHFSTVPARLSVAELETFITSLPV